MSLAEDMGKPVAALPKQAVVVAVMPL